MEPDSPAFEDDDEQPPSPPSTGLSSRLGPLEKLQRRYSDQLSQDIEQLEAEKAQLQADIAALSSDYQRLQSHQQALGLATEQLQSEPESSLSEVASVLSEVSEIAEVAEIAEVSEIAVSEIAEASETTEISTPTDEAESVLAQIEAAQPKISLLVPMPRLPGEPAIAPLKARTKAASAQALRGAAAHGSIELPIPATSEQRRHLSVQRQEADDQRDDITLRKGLGLSVIAAVLMAWHFCVVGALGQGGSWLWLSIEPLSLGFVPAVALLWLRMLVMLPALGLLAPHLYRYTWEDLQDWVYNRDQLLSLLIGSGIALFFSQVLIYQCIGTVGPALGAMLLFLYPLTAVPLGALLTPDRKISPLGLLAMVAIAMGGVLALKPSLGTLLNPIAATSTSIWLGILASVAFSLYVVLTNLSYRQQRCHPIPVSIVQFSTVAVLSSIVLFIKPLQPVAINWLNFSLWGILLGLMMLLVYLFSYSSLRLIGSRTGIVAAVVPLATLIIAWSFSPAPVLAILQWTGILLVTVGGIALGKERRERDSNPR